MKKSIYLLGMAVAALSSCSQSDVVEMPESAAIKFNSFVNNNTRVVNEITKDKLTHYFVFGNYGDMPDGAGFTEQSFNNEPQTTLYYWEAKKYYKFGAYANGNRNKIEKATFDAKSNTLTFPDYTPDDRCDLVAAIAANQVGEEIPETPLGLNFQHMLCQVGFTFKTEVGIGYTLDITNITIENAIKTGKGIYANGSIGWEGQCTSAAYTYDNVNDLANKENKQSQQYKLVIPQDVAAAASQTGIHIKFTASIQGLGLNSNRNFDIFLDAPENKWKPGYRYNYNATVNGENIIDNLQPIEFTVTELPNWIPSEAGDVNVPEV